MRRTRSASACSRARAFYLLGVTSLGLTLSAVACGKTEDDSSALATAGVGGTAAQGGAAGSGGGAHSGSGGRAGHGLAGASNDAAGAGGDTSEAGAGGTDEAGAAGAPGQGACEPGGSVFVVGNYVNATGDELLLRATPTASTFALVPRAPAVPAKPPRLFAVDRFCAAGGALIAHDGSSYYRADFSQNGGTIELCISAPVATLDAASSLPKADSTHASDTGCAGKPFASYTTEAL